MFLRVLVVAVLHLDITFSPTCIGAEKQGRSIRRVDKPHFINLVKTTLLG